MGRAITGTATTGVLCDHLISDLCEHVAAMVAGELTDMARGLDAVVLLRDAADPPGTKAEAWHLQAGGYTFTAVADGLRIAGTDPDITGSAGDRLCRTLLKFQDGWSCGRGANGYVFSTGTQSVEVLFVTPALRAPGR